MAGASWVVDIEKSQLIQPHFGIGNYNGISKIDNIVFKALYQ